MPHASAVLPVMLVYSPAGSVAGRVYEDRNDNGVQDAGEPEQVERHVEIEVGQAVAVVGAWGCGTCERCLDGLETYCERPDLARQLDHHVIRGLAARVSRSNVALSQQE